MILKHSLTSWYTLIEVLVGVLIVTSVTIAWLLAINSVGVGKIKLIEKTDLEQQAFNFSERFFEMIKSSGTIDYEEYFNRNNVGATSYLSGHYLIPTGFWNRATSMVYCISWDSDPMWNDGCITSYNTTWGDITGDELLYGQYAQQFIDYNSDADSDGGDENADGQILGDDDDKYLGRWPEAFIAGNPVQEIYLINSEKDTRTFFRWYVAPDPDAPVSSTCDFSNPAAPTGSGCLGTIQFLKLKWVDWWHDHILANLDATESDGVIDTWIYDSELYGLTTDMVADMTSVDSEDFWLPIFTDDVHVQNITIYPFPGKDNELAWAEAPDQFMSPYVRISMTLTPSWSSKRKIKWQAPTVDIHTTINLTPHYN